MCLIWINVYYFVKSAPQIVSDNIHVYAPLNTRALLVELVSPTRYNNLFHWYSFTRTIILDRGIKLFDIPIQSVLADISEPKSNEEITLRVTCIDMIGIKRQSFKWNLRMCIHMRHTCYKNAT